MIIVPWCAGWDPASSGLKRIQQRLEGVAIVTNLLHVDTGSFYRHITAELLQRGVPSTDLPALKTALATLQFSTRLNGRSAQMLIDAARIDVALAHEKHAAGRHHLLAQRGHPAGGRGAQCRGLRRQRKEETRAAGRILGCF